MSIRIPEGFLEELEEVYTKAEDLVQEDVFSRLTGFADFKKETIAELEMRMDRFKQEYGGSSRQLDELLAINDLLVRLVKYSL